MKLSTRGRYGLRAIYEIALSKDAPVAIKSIAQRQNIPEAYLEQLMASLRKAGVIKSSRGAQGGYELNRPPQEISIGEILLALEGSTSIADCLGEENCGGSCSCPSRHVFERIQQSIDSVLNSMTLADMIGQCESEPACEYNHLKKG